MATAKEIIDANLNGHGHAVYEAAKNAGFEIALNEEGRLDLADACALVDHESAGGQNIFGCDWGAQWTWEPPYCNVPVTAERVQALLSNIEGGGGQNGVGLTQLTSVELVREAERRGGAYLPENQLSVGFEYLKSLVDDLGYMYGIAAYNAGPGNAQLGIDNGYYGKIQAQREKWKELLAGSEEISTEPAIERSELVAEQITLEYDKEGWAYDTASGLYVKSNRVALDHKTNQDGWLWADVANAAITVQPPATALPTWSWPEAWDPPGYIGDDSYVDLHPERYNWRSDVEEVARYLVDTYGVWCNTYVDHPPGWGLDNVSMDVWAYSGRGYTIDPSVGQAVFDDIFNNGKEPWIWWVIWWGSMWSMGGGWEDAPWGPPDSDPGHYGHVHFTFV